MEFILQYGLFVAKIVTFLVVVLLVVAVCMSRGSGRRMGLGGDDKGKLVVTKLNDHYDGLSRTLRACALGESVVKAEEKLQKKTDKKSKDSQSVDRKKRVFVLDFNGDPQATATRELRESITAVLTLAEATDEVVLKLESPGGAAHSYGLAASQLDRIKLAGIPLTVCVDKVAASGGYMMACVGDKILASPFGILGSIGVVAQVTNFYRLLKKNDVDVELFTAGEYKRTVTVLGENTEEGKKKFKESLEDVHVLFKDFVIARRPCLDLDVVGTGEHWYGSQALEKKLVDEIMTSDSYLTSLHPGADIFAVNYEFKKGLKDKISGIFGSIVDVGIAKASSALAQQYSAK